MIWESLWGPLSVSVGDCGSGTHLAWACAGARNELDASLRECVCRVYGTEVEREVHCMVDCVIRQLAKVYINVVELVSLAGKGAKL